LTTLTDFTAVRYAACTDSGSWMSRSSVYATAAALNGVPSLNLIPLRTWIV